MCCLRILELSQHLDRPKCRSADWDLVGPGAHFLPNIGVPASKYLEHKWNLLVIKDAYAMPFFHYFRAVDGVFMCGFYSLSTVNSHSPTTFKLSSLMSSELITWDLFQSQRDVSTFLWELTMSPSGY